MTGQCLKLGKFMTDQVANTFGHLDDQALYVCMYV